MLTMVKGCKEVSQWSTALLVFISCSTFHTYACADIAEKTANDYRALGYAQQQKGNLNEALTHYTKAISLGFENKVLLNDMGVLYEEIGLNVKAEQFYLRALQVDDHYLPAHMNLAYLYLRRGKEETAVKHFKKRYELGNPMDPWALKAKEELLKLRPDYLAWAQSVEADSLKKELVAKSHEDFYWRVERSLQYYDIGNDLFAVGKYKEAKKEYDLALRLAPKNPKIQSARNKVILEIAKESIREQSREAIKRLEMGDAVSARNEIQKILTTIPKEPFLISQ